MGLKSFCDGVAEAFADCGYATPRATAAIRDLLPQIPLVASGGIRDGVQVAKALAVNPSLPLAHQLLGEAALAKGDSQTAIQELEAERKIDPLNGAVYDRLGDAYLRSGKYDEADW